MQEEKKVYNLRPDGFLPNRETKFFELQTQKLECGKLVASLHIDIDPLLLLQYHYGPLPLVLHFCHSGNLMRGGDLAKE